MFSLKSSSTKSSLAEESDEKKFSKVCAWCKETYDINIVEGSSGICKTCFGTLVESYVEMLDTEQAKAFQKILNSFDALI